MKCFFSIVLLVMTAVVCAVKDEDQTVISEKYPLDGDFNQIRASANIEFELTHVNSEPSVIIETEEWVHTGGYITVSTRPNNCLDITLKSDTSYPAIKVYVDYRTPLVSLEIDETSSVRSTNVIFSNPSSSLNLAHSGTGIAILELQHDSDINVAMSGTGQFILSGRVQGNGQLSVSGTAHLDAVNCPMKIVYVQVSGNGLASVNGVEGVHATVSGTGTICYLGTLLSQQISGSGSIKKCAVEPTTEKPPHSSSESGKTISRNRQLMTIPATITLFLFFQSVIN